MCIPFISFSYDRSIIFLNFIIFKTFEDTFRKSLLIEVIKKKMSAITPVPDHFVCPISLEIMVDPVICSDGITYERREIRQWLQNHNTSPKTNEELINKLLIPNYALKAGIDKFTATKVYKPRKVT